MAKFMNAELIAIRDNLECGHCNAIFKGSDSQAWKVKYEKRTVFCSVTCRSAATRKRLTKPKTERGPCPTCGKTFCSRTAKVYCSIDCYVKSKQFREMQSQHWSPSDDVKRKISETLKKGENVPCLECGEEFYQKPASKSRPAKKFCGTGCYRAFMAKRFDRWVANPEGMALPQCYDEFLDREELSCIVDGCDWRGKHLTLHVNQTHGVRSVEFKRAAGFNISTGVISKPLAKALRERETVGIALTPENNGLMRAHEAQAENPIRYKSLEGREHARKARAIAGPGPLRACKGCGKQFRQSTASGRALYCSIECRKTSYARQSRENAKLRVRKPDGTFEWVSRSGHERG